MVWSKGHRLEPLPCLPRNTYHSGFGSPIYRTSQRRSSALTLRRSLLKGICLPLPAFVFDRPSFPTERPVPDLYTDRRRYVPNPAAHIAHSASFITALAAADRKSTRLNSS